MWSRTFFSLNNNLGRSFKSRSFLLNLSWLRLVKMNISLFCTSSCQRTFPLCSACTQTYFIQPLPLLHYHLHVFRFLHCTYMNVMFRIGICKNKERAVEHSIIFQSFNIIFINTVYTMSQRLSLNINTRLRDIDTCNLDI